MLTITLYHMSAEDNRIDKSSALSEDFTIQAILKYPTSVTDPVIEIRLDNAYTYNYAFIPQFKRWYFVTNSRSLANGVWELSMHVDVLMSYKESIDGIKMRVGRTTQSGRYNRNLPDKTVKVEVSEVYENVYKILSIPHINNQSLKPNGKPTNRTKCFVVTTVNQAAIVFDVEEGESNGYTKILQPPASVLRGGNSFTNRWVCDQDEIVNFAKEALYDAQNVGSYIISIMAYPLDFEELQASLGLKFLGTNMKPKLGDKYIDGDLDNKNMYYLERDTIGILGSVGDTIIKIDRKFYDFRDYEPYSRYVMYLPYYGNYEIDAKYLYEGVYVEYLVDFATGDLNIVLSVDGSDHDILVDRLKCTLGVQIPISATDLASIDRKQAEVTTNAVLSTVAGVASMVGGIVLMMSGVGAPAGAGAIAGGFATLAGGTVAAISAPISGIVQSANLKSSGAGANIGGQLSPYFNSYFNLTKYSYLAITDPDEIAEVYGYPSDYVGTIATFSKGSFIMAEYVYMKDFIPESDTHNNSLKMSYQSEREEIIQFLLQGVRK